MTPQEKLEFEELKRVVKNLQNVTDPAFTSNIIRRIDIDNAVTTRLGKSSINDLGDVDITSISNGQVLKYTTAGTARWINDTDNIA